MNNRSPRAHTRRVRTLLVGALVALGLTISLAACRSTQSADANQHVQNNLSGAISQVFSQAVPYPYANCDKNGNCTAQSPSDPLERKNLAFRLQQYNSKGNTNYVYVFTFSGQVVGYYVIQGKVSSTASQMTSTQVNVGCGGTECTNDAPGDDGSYGPDEGGQFGVFFRTVGGALVETDLPFLVSNAPIPTYASVPQLQK